MYNRARTPDLTPSAALTWDLGAQTQAQVFMISGNNASINALGQFQAADDTGFTVNLLQSSPGLVNIYDTSLVATIPPTPIYTPPWGRPIIYVNPTDFTHRYLRWTQSDVGNTQGYQEWGLMRVGLAWQPAYGIDSTWKACPVLAGPQGSEKVLRGHQMTCHNLSKAEAYGLQQIALNQLSTGRLLVIPEGTTTNTYIHDAIWCVLLAVSSPVSSGRGSTTYSNYARDMIQNTGYSSKRYKITLTFQEVDR